MTELLQKILRIHLHPKTGTPYWLDRQQALGFSIADGIQQIEDLPRLGPFDLQALRERPLEDFVPGGMLGMRRLMVGETGGATGTPKTMPWFEDELHTAFVAPFLACTHGQVNFRAGHWLWLGPSGPHVIGKAARLIALATTGCDGFSVDFDPRWYRSLSEGSMARQRYLDHLVKQAGHIVEQQNIRYLFSTPVALAALAARMSPDSREAILFVYLGGMPVDPDSLERLGEAFPNAQFLSGYGNSLFGVSHEVGPHRPEGEFPVYFPAGARLSVRMVSLDESLSDAERLSMDVPYGERGQIVMSRLDSGCLLVNVMERDSAVRVASAAGGPDGIQNPQGILQQSFKVEKGIY